MTSEPSDIDRGLAAIRMRRRVFLAILFSLPPLIVFTMACVTRSGSWLPVVVPGAAFLAGMIVQRRLHRSRCPGCGCFFFVQEVSRASYTPLSSISFPPQKRCRGCGLALYD